MRKRIVTRKLFFQVFVASFVGALALWIASYIRAPAREIQLSPRSVLLLGAGRGRAEVCLLRRDGASLLKQDLLHSPDCTVSWPHDSWNRISFIADLYSRYGTGVVAAPVSGWLEFAHVRCPLSYPSGTMKCTRIRFPIPALAICLVIPPSLGIVRGPVRRWRRRKRNLCVHCGYNLTGNTSGVCPECGTAV